MNANKKIKDKVIIYGAGAYGENLFRNICVSTDIVCFIDGDKAKHGLKLHGLNVQDPRALKDLVFDKIVVASMYAEEIVKGLVKQHLINPSLISIAPSSFGPKFHNAETRAEALYWFKRFIGFLNKHDLKWWLDHSTLLGLIREKNLLIQDIDIGVQSADVGCLLLEINKSEFKNMFSIYLQKPGRKNDLIDKGSVIFLKSAYIDIHVKYRSDRSDQVFWMVDPILLAAKSEHFISYEERLVDGIPLKLPLEAESYLNTLYGNWTVKRDDWTYKDYANIVAVFPWEAE